MNDFYAECLVKKGKQNRMTLVMLTAAVGAVFGIISVLYIGPMGFVIFLVMCGICFFAQQNKSVEYEYLLAGEQFCVDCIFNKSRRKKAVEYNLEEIQAVAPEDSAAIREFDRQVKKAQDFTSGHPGATRYAVIRQKAGVTEKIIIEPDDKLLHCFKKALPRKFSGR